MAYEINIRPAAIKALKKVPKDDVARVDAKIQSLAVDPRPVGSEKLKDSDEMLRVRVGDYRIIDTVDDGKLLVLVLTIGDRKEVYR